MIFNPTTGQLEGEIEKIPEGTSESIIKQVIWGKSPLAPKFDDIHDEYDDKVDREYKP